MFLLPGESACPGASCFIACSLNKKQQLEEPFQPSLSYIIKASYVIWQIRPSQGFPSPPVSDSGSCVLGGCVNHHTGSRARKKYSLHPGSMAGGFPRPAEVKLTV